MLNIDYSKCCGCGSCANACPQECISMMPDREGFLYPNINVNECIRCSKCEYVCPLNKKNEESNYHTAFAAVNLNETERRISSSGGMFLIIARHIILSGGVVFGAAFDESFLVNHSFSETIDGLKKFCGSKYLQSDLKDSFVKAKEFLIKGVPVLFTGTACQIAGLKSFLCREYDNLYTLDLICHGVAAPVLWKKYINSLKKGKPKSVSFRDKSEGWNCYRMKINFENDSYSMIYNKDRFMEMFLNNICLRESCYNCSFKISKTCSDITLADFWKVEEIMPELNDDKGVSLVLVNSPKGKMIIERIKNQAILTETDFSDAILYNENAYKSVERNYRRDLYLKYVNKKSFDYLYNYCYNSTKLERLKTQIVRFCNKVKK